MSQSPGGPPSGSSTRGLWILILVLLAPAIVIPLWVSIYDRYEPTLLGFPFFFWFQFALIAVSAVMTGIAYKLSRIADRKDRGQ